MFDPRRFLEFLHYSPAGKFLTFLAIAIVLLIFFKGCKQRGSSRMIWAPDPKSSEPIRRSGSSLEFSQKDKTKPPPPKDPEPLPPIRIFSATNAMSAGEFAALPYGWLIPCRLVGTVDSSDKETPIIAFVMEDVFFEGALVIPKDAIIHGRALNDRTRDRVMTQNQWVLVFPSGHELRFSGLALNMDRVKEQWGEHDGSPGLQGFVVRAEKNEELKLVIAGLLSGSTEAFKDRRDGLYYSRVLPTAKNAALGSVGTVLDTYAQRLLQSIPADFVRVPAGKGFYVYPTERIELANAKPLPKSTAEVSQTIWRP